jgi:hypothetical protein
MPHSACWARCVRRTRSRLHGMACSLSWWNCRNVESGPGGRPYRKGTQVKCALSSCMRRGRAESSPKDPCAFALIGVAPSTPASIPLLPFPSTIADIYSLLTLFLPTSLHPLSCTMRNHAGCVRGGKALPHRFAACHSIQHKHINCRWELRHWAATADCHPWCTSALLLPVHSHDIASEHAPHKPNHDTLRIAHLAWSRDRGAGHIENYPSQVCTLVVHARCLSLHMSSLPLLCFPVKGVGWSCHLYARSWPVFGRGRAEKGGQGENRAHTVAVHVESTTI